MRRTLYVVLVALGLSLVSAPLAGKTTRAATQAVDAWVTIGAIKPSVGCSVDVIVEIRSSSGAVDGADVALALSIDGDGSVISSDRGTSNSSGVSYLTFDTSDGWNGAKTWLEIMVNGSYLGGRTVWIENGGPCEGGGDIVELGGSVATTRDSVVDGNESVGRGDGPMIANVPAYKQQRNLSCEYAALSIATGALGGWVSEWEFDNRVGWHANPHKGYRGDITGWWGNTTDYGVYPEALVGPLADFGFRGETFYGMGDASGLKGQLSAGKPVVVWLGMWGDTSIYDWDKAGDRFQLTSGMHVMTAYGYDSGGIHLADPATGTFRYYDWGTFMWMWNVMDGMSLAVSWA